jgi:hypothetical protein
MMTKGLLWTTVTAYHLFTSPMPPNLKNLTYSHLAGIDIHSGATLAAKKSTRHKDHT